VKRGIQAELLDERLANFDLKKLGSALDASRDLKFGYLGLQTLYDRYSFTCTARASSCRRRFSCGSRWALALNEIDREARAIEFYKVLSSFDFMSSTPTLFNSGTARSQLSSCYLTTVSDDLDGIYEAIKENALLAKYAGALGNDWTPVRALGSHIKGTNGKSQGVVPFLKVVNDTAVAVNQGGKRKGAVCSYLETWHLDIEEFLELRKNTATTAPHARHEHRQLDSGPVHEAGDGERRLDAVQSLGRARPARQARTRVRKGVSEIRGKSRQGRVEAVQEAPRLAALAQDAVDAVRNRAPVDHFQGSLQSALAAAACGRRATAPICAPRSRSHQTTRKSRCATSGRSTWLRT